MALRLTNTKRELQFNFAAKTSRGSLQQHTAHYLKLYDTALPAITGLGEASPLADLSIDAIDSFEKVVHEFCSAFNKQNVSNVNDAAMWFREQELQKLPALKFGFETALIDFTAGGNGILFDTAFSRGEAGIPINGLIWMGDKQFMQDQIKKKLQEGFSCLKLKIGGLDFKTELQILASIREIAPPTDLVIRLDANGAFSAENAMEKLKKLSTFYIHSIEQPIRPGQTQIMANLCQDSPIPVALDEELIGISNPEQLQQLLTEIKPAYIILKPTLLGGLAETKNWITLAESYKIKWWLTSALESNIGLSAISQFTATYPNVIPQGLGTGQLYTNNMASTLEVEKGFLYYRNA